MIRARFYVNGEDYRPVNWPIKHPYWCTGYKYNIHSDDEDDAIIVAYADDEAEILANWPDAKEIDAEEKTEYVFTSRFEKPEWFESDADAGTKAGN